MLDSFVVDGILIWPSQQYADAGYFSSFFFFFFFFTFFFSVPYNYALNLYATADSMQHYAAL